jgi:hypothetical protein
MTDQFGGASKHLFSVQGSINYYTLSPNAKFVLYDDGVRMKIRKLDDSSEVTIDNGIHKNSAVFSPDSKQLLITTVGSLAVINIDGSGEKIIADTAQIANSALEHFPHPYDWSPDGQKICFYKNAGSTYTPSSLVIYDFVTEKKTTLITDSFYYWTLNWSPSGKYIPFQKYITLPSQNILKGKLSLYDVDQMKSQSYTIPYPNLPGNISAYSVSLYEWSEDEHFLLLGASADQGFGLDPPYQYLLLDVQSGIISIPNLSTSGFTRCFFSRKLSNN